MVEGLTNYADSFYQILCANCGAAGPKINKRSWESKPGLLLTGSNDVVAWAWHGWNKVMGDIDETLVRDVSNGNTDAA
jgi:hypothetical protein